MTESDVFHLACIGVSHKDMPLASVALVSEAIKDLPTSLMQEGHSGVTGVVLLATCNRVELYLDSPTPRLAAEAVHSIISKNLDESVLLPAPLLGSDAVTHLFSVTCGLESMVVGENEVSGQVNKAITMARRAGTASPSLERIFQSALSTAKDVSTATDLGKAGRSIVSVALDLAEQHAGPVKDNPVLLLGTGAYARVAHASLTRRGAKRILVYSNSGRGERFVESHGGTLVKKNQLVPALQEAGFVLACSGAPQPIVTHDTLLAVTHHRRSPLTVLDLALTRDVEVESGSLPTVTLIDLEYVSRHTTSEYSSAVIEAGRLVREAIENLGVKESGRAADSSIIALRGHVNALLDREMQRIVGKADEETVDAIHTSLRRFANELLHEPTARARAYALEGSSGEYADALRTIFPTDQ